MLKKSEILCLYYGLERFLDINFRFFGIVIFLGDGDGVVRVRWFGW